MTFGIDYKFYKAINYSRGYFKGTRIDHYGFFSLLMNFIYRLIK